MSDQYFNCLGGNYAGVPYVTTSIEGIIGSNYFDASLIVPSVTTLISGSVPISGFFNAGLAGRYPYVTTSIDGDYIVEGVRSNWVGWSKIGEITFVADRTNDSGYKPMSWKGMVYNILKLGKNAVIYGEGGVSILKPVDSPHPTFATKDIASVGLKNRNTVCGDDVKHYFMDKLSRLWVLTVSTKTVSLTEMHGATLLGYEEFLSTLTDPVMSYDPENEWVYISDATQGFVLTKEGLGGGYGGITAIQYQAGVKTVASPAVLSTPPTMLVVTDIIDFGYRGQKTIEAVEIGTDAVQPLSVALDYRFDKAGAFVTTPYAPVNKEGIGWIRAAGIEFRVRIRNLVYEDIELDYLNIHYKPTDKRGIRGVIGGFKDAN